MAARSPRLTALVAIAAAGIAPLAINAPAHAAGDLYVGPNGSNGNPGTRTAPLASVQEAVDRATPGTTIRILAGTYAGKVQIKKSGTVGSPIRITSAGNGPVQLTYNSKPEPCNNSQPAADRTIMITKGSDHWTIDSIGIHNGIWMAGEKSNIAYNWLTARVNALDAESRRRVPGHGTRNPNVYANAIAYLRSVTGTPDIDPAYNIKILNNRFTGRGVYGALASNGIISGNRISNIPCGIGPGIWLMTFANNWTITNNDVSDIAVSTASHYMQEGIRLGSASDYNTVTGNTVHDLPGDGRGINTDVDSSWNYIHHNTARNLAIGFNEQMAGWGNRWEYNTVTNYRMYGFGYRLQDAPLASPRLATSSNMAIVRCNVTSNPVGKAKALGGGAMMNATFQGNVFPLIWLSKNLVNYWPRHNNRYNGSTAVPSSTPPVNTTGC